MAYDDGELWGCGWQFDDAYAIAKSTNGDEWTRLYNLADLRGPLSCPAGTSTHDLCEPLWPQLGALLRLRVRRRARAAPRTVLDD